MKTVTIDLETTGLPPKGANYKSDYMQFPYIVSMAWKVNDQPRQEYIINQKGRPIQPASIAIHGITNEMAESSKFDLFSVMVQFMMDCSNNDFSIGHNIYFDTSIIKANVLRIVQRGKTPMQFYDMISQILRSERRIDTMRASLGLGYGKWLKLSELYRQLFNEDYTGQHSAGDDVDATYKCYVELVKRGLIKRAI